MIETLRNEDNLWLNVNQAEYDSNNKGGKFNNLISNWILHNFAFQEQA